MPLKNQNILWDSFKTKEMSPVCLLSEEGQDRSWQFKRDFYVVFFSFPFFFNLKTGISQNNLKSLNCKNCLGK